MRPDAAKDTCAQFLPDGKASASFSSNGITGIYGMGLSPRELEATVLAAGDMSAKEIAKAMQIAPGTVSKRLDDARFKLGAKTVLGLVVEAVRRGIIRV
ncbi:helix-turn-helix transcriptional regulator [Pseudomonas denitrificans (nom. rej.)]|uniref:Helix-turn-helix transcriptional regulator n=1 Tax=Pseudomonas denitrificans TaxID=43306 RepID=A0A9X7N1M2_PSEDE|nr:helix-turn-helix transcriptional regulator [Pseudomonas denitrificans (nom. rej.)]